MYNSYVKNRYRGSTSSGGVFSEETKRLVWEKGELIPGQNRNDFRRDCTGRTIRYTDHGNVNSSFGWEIDHIKPVSKGGSDDLINLQPLQWEVNRDKGDTYPWYHA